MEQPKKTSLPRRAYENIFSGPQLGFALLAGVSLTAASALAGLGLTLAGSPVSGCIMFATAYAEGSMTRRCAQMFAANPFSTATTFSMPTMLRELGRTVAISVAFAAGTAATGGYLVAKEGISYLISTRASQNANPPAPR